jgi:hypothetical protein
MDNYMQENTMNRETVSAESAKAFVTQVFGWMFLALMISGVISYVFASSDLFKLLIDSATHKPSTLYWVALFSPIAIVIAMGYGLEKLSFGVILILFVAYASLIGICLSSIFRMFDPIVLAKTFGVTAGTFGVMAIAGYTTKADLSRFGMILWFAFVGIFLASFINILIGSSMLSLMIDVIGIFVFTGLIAWKMQLVRKMAEEYGTSQPKMAVWMGLQLYVSFVNLFLTLLRFMRR